MDQQNSSFPEQAPLSNERKPSLAARIIRVIIGMLVPLILIAAGCLIAWQQIRTSPKSKRQPPPRQAQLVEIIEPLRRDYPVTIEAMGTVTPARQVNLTPQISGQITEVDDSIIPGSTFQAGQTLMKIDPRDYELLVQQRRSAVADAQTNLKLEHGNQAIAQQEFDLLGEVIADEDHELVLRQPQLLSAQAALQAAQAQLQQARLDLERTTITAPFNAAVQKKYIELGAMVSPSTQLVNLIGTDEYWVEVLVPVNQLKWIEIPAGSRGKGSSVRIYNSAAWGPETYRLGRVIRLRNELDTDGRMAKLLISVPDPLSLKEPNADTPILLIGSYVRVEVECRSISSAISIQRQLLRDGDNIWVMTPENTLEIRPIQIVFRDQNEVVINEGILEDEKIIITDLPAAVDGMPLRLQSDQATDPQPGKTNSKKPMNKRGGNS